MLAYKMEVFVEKKSRFRFVIVFFFFLAMLHFLFQRKSFYYARLTPADCIYIWRKLVASG